MDYHISDLRPVEFLNILLGNKSEHLPHVLESDADDNVFVFWSGHGSPVWMSNRFSATLQNCMKTDPDMALSNLYYMLFQSTVGSHVHVYGIQGYGSLYSHTLEGIF